MSMQISFSQLSVKTVCYRMNGVLCACVIVFFEKADDHATML